MLSADIWIILLSYKFANQLLRLMDKWLSHFLDYVVFIYILVWVWLSQKGTWNRGKYFQT